MDKQLNDIELIERYLEDTLNEKDREAFNERIKTDNVFADTFKQRKLLQVAYIEASKRHELKKNIRSVVTDVKHKNANLRKVWLVAASFIILAGIGSIFLMQSKHASNNSMAKQDSNLLEDEVVTGKKNQIEEYGSVDTFNKQSQRDIISFRPIDGSVFYLKDTIWFSLANMNSTDTLIIYNSSGSVSKRLTIQPGTDKYKLLPYILKPGTYTWNYSLNKSVTHSFSIK
jgi:hypothetical protein